MQKNLKTISILIFVVLGAFTLASGTKANFQTRNRATKNTDKIAARELFISNCARCHGANGAGETELGKKLDVPDLTISGKRINASKITRIVTNGKEEMPAFGKRLSKKQIASLAAFVRKL